MIPYEIKKGDSVTLDGVHFRVVGVQAGLGDGFRDTPAKRVVLGLKEILARKPAKPFKMIWPRSEWKHL